MREHGSLAENTGEAAMKELQGEHEATGRNGERTRGEHDETRENMKEQGAAEAGLRRRHRENRATQEKQRENTENMREHAGKQLRREHGRT